METFSHQCIKCSETYTDTDPEVYYCPTCNEQRKAIAKEVDAKLKMRPKKPVESAIAQYDRLRNARGFVNIKDLGISL